MAEIHHAADGYDYRLQCDHADHSVICISFLHKEVKLLWILKNQIQTDRESLIQDIMKLVSIDSVETAPDAGMPFGAGAAKALDCFLETAESIGLKTENFDHYAGHADYGDQEETLGILGHVDVVPCSGSWVCDPFKPEIIDGKLYGRGVLDDKGPLLACLHAVKILKEWVCHSAKKSVLL